MNSLIKILEIKIKLKTNHNIKSEKIDLFHKIN